jgi:2,5-furandicarboxylate decarboxylase 1
MSCTMAKDLRQFVALVKSAGPDFYVESRKPLDSQFEVGVLQQKLARKGRFPVVYCPEIKGHQMPLVTNVFGGYDLIGLALDLTPEMLEARGRGEVRRQFAARRDQRIAPREISSSEAPVQEVVLRGRDADLNILPITAHGEHDSGKYITAGMTVIKDPDTGVPNVGIYRHELKGGDKLGCSFIPGKHGAQIAARYAARGERMEVVTVIGHHPATALASVMSGPMEMNELEAMGGLLDEPLEVTPGVTVDLPVPARAEIAIEGIIDPNEGSSDGPFGEFLGYYGAGGPCHVIRVKAITMRRDAIYQDLMPSHQEHNLVGTVDHEADIYERVRSVVPSVNAVHFGPDGRCGKPFVYISIDKRSPGQGRLAGLAALASRRYFKTVVVVDDDIDVYDQGEVMWAIGTRARWDQDSTVLPRLPTSTMNPLALDESGTRRGPLDAKMLIDATKPLDPAFPERADPPKALWDAMALSDYIE